MKKDGYYSSGTFAAMAHITKKTLRYYDEHHILRPAYVSESGARFYSDANLAKLQQILLLKYLGFSLDDIREMTITSDSSHHLKDSLELQQKLVEDQIEQLQLVSQAICDITQALDENQIVNWSQMLDLIHLTGMEASLKNQYQNASNISSRIHLHSLYSQNPEKWFPWVFRQCPLTPGMHVLEIGCGDGTLWSGSQDLLPGDLHVVLSDKSEGMLRDAKRMIHRQDFSYLAFDCQCIPFPENTFDLVIANHVLFYCDQISTVCQEVRRVLKPHGTFLCSTYGSQHMREVSQLVQNFDDRILLSGEKLYDRFGRENGQEVLSPWFSQIQWVPYNDHLLVTESEPLISYILSCHGNQNQYILDRYKDFRSFVKKKTTQGFYITKDAGIFLCTKE